MVKRKEPGGNEWMASGWFQVLPMVQGQWLWLLLNSATKSAVDGDLDELVARGQSGGERWFDNATGGLDAPIFWGYSSRPEWRSSESDAADAHRRAQCVTALAELGLDEPETVRDLAGLMNALGLCLREPAGDGYRWRTPPVLPLPAEVLPMDPEWVAEADRGRWQYQISAITGELAELFTEQLGRPDEAATTVAELARLIDRDPEDVRQGLVDFAENPLTFLTAEPIVTLAVDTPEGPVTADPERLADDEPLRIAFDWAALDRRKLRIRRLDPERPAD